MNSLDRKLDEYKTVQISALEKMCPIAAEALAKFFQERIRESRSIGEIGGIVRDFTKYVEDVSTGRIFGPYISAIGGDTDRKSRYKNIVSLPNFSLKESYGSFAAFVTDVYRQTDVRVDPFSRYLGVSNNTLLTLIHNSENPLRFIPKQSKRPAGMERVRYKILDRLGITGKDRERLTNLPIYGSK